MDQVFAGFLEHQLEKGMELAARSTLLTLVPSAGAAPDRYVAHLACRGLVRASGGEIVESEGFEVGIWFPADYLRRANALEVVSWLGPRNVFHPNVGPGPNGGQFICAGRIERATPLVEILMRVYEIVTYQRVTMDERDALDHEACAWARGNQERFPIDRRTILGETIALRAVEPAPEVHP